jgi:hypothetical protein
MDDMRDEDFDLLTAAVIGAAIGAALTLLVTGISRAASPPPPTLRSRAKQLGEELTQLVPHRRRGWLPQRKSGARRRVEASGDRIGEFLHETRDRVNDAVETELRDLRRALRRQRKRIGV